MMAANLATTPTTATRVQVGGDCHLLDFGGSGTPERNLVFDVNDFDETLPAPWKWDVKRLATSIVVAGRHIGVSAKNCEEAARTSVCSYREHMNKYAQMGALEVWYLRIDADGLRKFSHPTKHRQRIEHARGRSNFRASCLSYSGKTHILAPLTLAVGDMMAV